ncbi:MAG: type VI-D CRISPR-associated RNA-guided ribonuclease Cas13d [Planctomycetia bacterium]|nr:type VI-D CRISPR-associated RNA-guided ribonuclease Cas13d [Planctomycetia bacterium]
MSKNKKTRAKRMGVKSVFAHGEKGRLAITSFGKGNRAELVVDTDSRGKSLCLPHRVPGSVTIDRIDEEIGLSRSTLEALVNNPAERDSDDYLGLKGELEEMFFGEKFPRDTVRIQIIHNILDILKILGLYVGDIVYCINNLQDVPIPDDQIGKSLCNEKKVEDILRCMEPFLGYFGEAFRARPQMKVKKPAAAGKQMRDERFSHNKNAIYILSTIRHNTAHFKKSFFFFQKDLNKKFTGASGSWKIVEENYKNLIDRINSKFVSNSSINLRILFELLSAESLAEQTAIAEEYYCFSILKKGKNLGIGMKKLREYIIELCCPEIKNKVYDSYRSKLYTILDYLLYRTICDSDELVLMVEELRETADEDAKERLYRNNAVVFWEKIEQYVHPFLEKFKDGFPVFSSDKYPASLIDKVALKADGVPFVQLLAFLCDFWEGKEINEILSAYIHKFENIQAFIDTLENLGERLEFKACPIFNEPRIAERVAAELRILASIGKMKPDLSSVKRPLYKAAIAFLGVNESHECLTDEWLAENLLLDGEAPREKKESTNPFRNFIVNNVIKSRRFMYLVRYTKPQTVHALMGNREIVRYVLTRLPEKQVDTYYENIEEPNENDALEDKIRALTAALTNFSFENLRRQKERIVENSLLGASEKILEIEQLKALTGLYLTVAYVAVKNLIKTNARYYIAFSAFERDYELFLQKDKSTIEDLRILLPFLDKKGKNTWNECLALTRYFLKKEEENDYHPEPGKPFDKEACRKHLDSIKRHFSKKWREIFQTAINDALQISDTGYLPIVVRNHAAHLNVLSAQALKYVSEFRAKRPGMQSYFELYHFLLQKLMCENPSLNILPEHQKYLNAGVPCLDLIKIAYVSLGYNLPRFKNLTIEALFDEDSESGKERIERRKSKR